MRIKFTDIKIRISAWWNGELYKNDPLNDIYYIGPIRHSTSAFVHSVIGFLKREYQFILNSALALDTVILTWLNL